MLSRLSQWLSRRARSRQLARYAISDALWTRTLSGLPFLLDWPQAALARLRETATLFIAEKEFTTAHGLALTDEMVVSIAAQASVPILELGIAWYRGWRGVVLYPGEFLIRGEAMDEDGVVHDVRQEASGEAAANGLVLLSWQDIELGSVLAGPDIQPYNVVMHEFAHKLDMLNGEADGIPAFSSRLHAGLDREQWADDLYAEYDAFAERCDRIPERRWDADPILSLLDPYGAQHPAEFFAVASEVFFVEPAALQDTLPALYALLQAFYLQDPARRMLDAGRHPEPATP
ncbi:M90 family metallopeptidase [Ralstonia pseudosolanacearum]|uniref:M90 family metallopeptidase n=1 Tax=Ralstonia pseudosolanacearum TaxID=1310165 RepID=UPI000B92F2A1|nr:zinc-dependent peptidase [Ralstonia pseudosolanacearum]MCD9229196.1 zinc-dependent peptidase [Ralstonia pseudosolanacearum]